MRQQIVIFSVFCFLAQPAFAAPASEPAPLTVKQIKKVKAGMTRAEVTTLVGAPGKVRKTPDGGEIWIYRHKEKKTRPSAPDLPYPKPEESRLDLELKVIFNAKGIAQDAKQKILKENEHSYLVPPDKVEKPEEQGS